MLLAVSQACRIRPPYTPNHVPEPNVPAQHPRRRLVPMFLGLKHVQGGRKDKEQTADKIGEVIHSPDHTLREHPIQTRE